MKKLILFTSLLFSVLLIYGQRDVQGNRVIALDSVYINGEWISFDSPVDGQSILRENGRWTNADGAGDSNLDTISGSSYVTVQDWMNVTQSAGIITGGVITDDLDGTVTVSAGSGIVKKTNSEIGANELFDFAEDATLTLTDESINYIYLDYNSGSPVMGNSTTNTANGRTIFNLGKVFKEGTHIDIINSGLAIYDITKRNQQRIKETYGFQFVSGAIVAEVGTRQISMTAGIMYAGNNRITTDAINTSTGDTFEYYYYDGTDWQETGSTTIDNLQYNDITTGLATLSNNQHGVHWVYKGTEDHSYVIYGQDSYTLVAAQASQPPVSLPPHVEEMGVLRAKIIIEKSGTVFEEIESVADITFSSGAASDHNELTGLDGGEAGYYGHLTSAEKLRVAEDETLQSVMLRGDTTSRNITINSSATANLNLTGTGDNSDNAAINMESESSIRARGTRYTNRDNTGEWFSGLFYQSEKWGLGYDMSGGESEYTENRIFYVDSVGNGYFNGTVIQEDGVLDNESATVGQLPSLGNAGEVAHMNTTGTAITYSSLFKYDNALSILEARNVQSEILYNLLGEETAKLTHAGSGSPVFQVYGALLFEGYATMSTSPGFMYFNTTYDRWRGKTTNDGAINFLMEGDVDTTEVTGLLEFVENHSSDGSSLWTDYSTYDFVVADNNRAVYSGDTGSAIYIKDNDATDTGTGFVGVDYDGVATEFIKLDGFNSEVTINQSVFMPDIDTSSSTFFVNIDTTTDEIGYVEMEIDTTLPYTLDSLRTMTTFNSKTDNYTLVLSDAGKTIKVTAAIAKSITIPLNATVAYPVGTYINISSLGAGVVTVAITATGTLTSNDDKVDIIEDGMVTVLKYDTNSWQLFGGLE